MPINVVANLLKQKSSLQLANRKDIFDLLPKN